MFKVVAEKIDATGKVTARTVYFASSIRVRDGDLKMTTRSLEIKQLPGDTKIVSVSGEEADYTQVRVFNLTGEVVHTVEFDISTGSVSYL